ncbi:hypothetical protein [Rhodococcoides fascians]|uniref:hypothetical protein n=1 Tax=Rhodococcoides fascians TaxID=1828 RepID=UPI00050CAC42|nr:hypothetical protein [Rhodococcus fascians]
MTQPSTPQTQRVARSIMRPIASPEGSVLIGSLVIPLAVHEATDLNAVATTRYERTCAVLQERAAMD